ncbi:metallophosphoesterase [Microbacterium wangruii]|uniref:metallophosphoesterase n=1 Tax=Microbacterium wangruii TaxID=3049073 RepID=UPI00256EDF6A|nr:metallophosphoesterase [Microbacterium sp. zg-Y1211]MDL5486119.1 metallophosphoesterase [Microbacterium sp. zg-Y1211]
MTILGVYERRSEVTLPDRRVAVCDDWHGNGAWVQGMLSGLRRAAPDVTTILQVGDWEMDAEESDAVFHDAGIERVLVTLGNHERWGDIAPLQALDPGCALRVSDVTWLLPRPYRLRIGGRTVLSLGGATSVDRARRVGGCAGGLRACVLRR